MRTLITLLLLVPASAMAEFVLHGPSMTGCAIQRDQLFQQVHEEGAGGNDFDRYERVCSARSCTYRPPAITGEVVYHTYFGDQVVIYHQPLRRISWEY